MKKSVLIIIGIFLFFSTSADLLATTDEEAKESEAYCNSTAKTEPTPLSLIIQKVDEGCAILQNEGLAALPKFRGKGSSFLFDGTYIWIHGFKDNKMIQHPIKNKMEGKDLTDLVDKNGKKFFMMMNNVVKEKGAGWVEYLWPKPGTKDYVKKISYVKGCKTKEGQEVVLGCGIYNSKKEEIDKLELH
ncbi:MAG: cache domain-containing protein [Desulfobacterales bacterium]|nr:cache domain-containing protein [Desulfobacterales bacterium]MBF0397125.1 cache domain-containing protein [Desulfobacterales bacterium]